MSETKSQDARAAYRQSDWYDAESINGLRRQLDALSQSDDALRSQAEAEYRPAYETQKNALRDTLERETASAQAERDALAAAHDKRRRLTNENFDRSAAALNNTLNARGLGRSSLTGTQNAYLERERGRALDDIGAEESSSVSAINRRIAQLAENAARDERTLDGSYADKLTSRISALKSANQTAAISLQLQIAALQQQGYEAYRDSLLKERAQQLDEDEFRQKYGLNSAPAQSGRSSSGGRTRAVQSAVKTPAASAPLKSLSAAMKNLLARKNGRGTLRTGAGSSTGASGSSYKPGIKRRAFG